MAGATTWSVNKVALITGGSSGIGKEVAFEFASLGIRLALVSLPNHAQDLAAVGKECKEKGAPDVLEIGADLADPTECKRVVEETTKYFKQLDILIGNSGIATDFAKVGDLPFEDWERTMNVNLRANFLLIKQSLPSLISSKGCVVLTSSILGERPVTHLSAYSVSKAAVNQLVRNCALEYATEGVRFNAVAPTIVGGTNMGKPAVLRSQAKMQPTGRVAEVSDIAPSIVYLCSPAAKFVTGHILTIDGGRLLLGVSIPQ